MLRHFAVSSAAVMHPAIRPMRPGFPISNKTHLRSAGLGLVVIGLSQTEFMAPPYIRLLVVQLLKGRLDLLLLLLKQLSLGFESVLACLAFLGALGSLSNDPVKLLQVCCGLGFHDGVVASKSLRLKSSQLASDKLLLVWILWCFLALQAIKIEHI